MSEIEKMLSDPMVLRELVMDHYQYPHNHKLTRSDLYRSVHMASESCIDDITVESRIENGVIKDIQFEGEACTISTSSTSIMTDLLIPSFTKNLEEQPMVCLSKVTVIGRGRGGEGCGVDDLIHI